MTETRNYTTDKYGNFSIEQMSKGFVIWWDFYDEEDGLPMETDGDFIEWFTPGCDVKDFSDLPEGGYFKSFEEAEKYLFFKFGTLK